MAKNSSATKVSFSKEYKQLSAIRGLPLHQNTLSIQEAVAIRKVYRCRLPPHLVSIFKLIHQRMQFARQRCEYKKCREYQRYGARGIKFLFPTVEKATLYVLEHLPHPTYEGLEIDRIDNDGHYEPGNLKLSTRTENANNCTDTVWVPIGNQRMPLQEFRRAYPESGYGNDQISDLVRRGFTGEQIIKRNAKREVENSWAVQTRPARQVQAGNETTKKAKVYDIVNAGPRHRFMASGVVVSNCRLLNFIAGQDDVIERFRNNEDPYVKVATEFFGYEVNRKDHPNERATREIRRAPSARSFGSGGPKIASTVRIKSKGKIILTPEEGLKARDAYRDTHPDVVNLWATGGRMLARLAGGPPIEWGPTTVRDGRIYLPNGCPLDYSTLEHYKDPETGEGYWRLKTRRGWTKYYGAKLVENLIQALARVVISQAFIRIVGLGYRIVGTEHDSLWILVPKDGKEQWHLDRCLAEMRREPPWLPGIPLDAQ